LPSTARWLDRQIPCEASCQEVLRSNDLLRNCTSTLLCSSSSLCDLCDLCTS
jgi:hypothetical protein